MISLEMAIQKIQQLPVEQRNQVIQFVEFLEFQSSQADPIQTQKKSKKISFAEAAHEFVGCLDSNIDDLSHNPKYLEEFGK
jgi:hemerythrin superfamily protein